MQRLLSIGFIAGLLPLLVAVPSTQTVLVVDDDGPADFQSLAQALAAAPDGATVLVRDGVYAGAQPVRIAPRSLVITADAGANVEIEHGLFVQGLQVGQTLVVRGITFDLDFHGVAVGAEDCQGVLWLEDVVVTLGVSILDGPSAVSLRACDSVVVVRSSLHGSGALDALLPGGPAIDARHSSLHVFDSELIGGEGGYHVVSPSAGGPGIRLEGGFLFAESSHVQGGQGGPVGGFGLCEGGTGGIGGPGVELLGASPQASLLGGTLAGGLGGASLIPTSEPCPEGAVGPASLVSAGTLVSVSAPDHGFAVTSPVEAGTPSIASFSGVPGEVAWFLYGASPATHFLSPLLGTLALDFPLAIAPAGALDASGSLEVGIVAGLPPGVDSRLFHLQALFLEGGTGGFAFGSPSALVVLAHGL
jgi:hypothetical protein